jgi:uncharacterized membrane protein YfcA
MLNIFLIGIIVMMAIMIEGIIGFGAAAFALPFLTLIITVHRAVPLMSSFSIFLGIYVVARNRKCIDWNVLKAVFVIGAPAFLVGMIVSGFLSERTLKLILGFVITVFAIKSLIERANSGKEQKKQTPLTGVLQKTALIVGSALHGAFGCGGPLMVIYVSRYIEDKTRFRTTMAIVWTVYGSVLLIRNTVLIGEMDADFVTTWISALVFFLIGMLAGDKLHRIIKVSTFRILADLVLLCSGISTLIIQLV